VTSTDNVPEAISTAPLPMPAPPPPPQQAPPPLPATLTASLSAVQQQSPVLMATLERTHPAKWKVKGDERTDVEHNYLSVKDDLEQTLPGLLSDAQKSPQSMDKGLAVYHNVVALNNVLVRLQQTAQLAGGREDAAILQEALSGVEVVRRQLADGLAAVSADQERALAQSRAALVQEKQRLAAAEAAEAKLKAQRAAATDDSATKKKPVKGARKKPAASGAQTAAAKPHPAAPGQSQAQ
jgi:hypothetical protein